MGAGPYAATHPNPWQERGQLGAYALRGGLGESIGLGRMPSGLRRHRAPNNSLLVSPVDVSGLVRGKMPVFSPAQAI